MRFCYVDNATLTLQGDTFPIKDDIKSAGGRWKSPTWVLVNSPQNMEFVIKHQFSIVTQANTDVANNRALTTTEEPRHGTLERTWTVSEFSNRIANLIQTHLQDAVWITGDISNLKKSNGHRFFDLAESKEDASQKMGQPCSLSCVLWAGRFAKFLETHGEVPMEEGLKVRILVHVEYRKDRGTMSAIVDDIDMRHTLGDLALSRQKVIAELRKRNIFDLNKRTKFPLFPMRIALLTARDSRAFTDFVDELTQSHLSFCVVVFDCNMQGEKTAANIANALSQLPDDTDAVVITRGGGSRLDLRWFDDIEIAKAVCYCKYPVITAIGHTDDVSISDEVAFCAEKTPTGAARYLKEHVLNAFDNLSSTMTRTASRILNRIQSEKTKVENLQLQIASKARVRLHTEKTRIGHMESSLKLASQGYLKPLQLGYARIHSTKQNIQVGDALKVEIYKSNKSIIYDVNVLGVTEND